jgi:hypothetical protein
MKPYKIKVAEYYPAEWIDIDSVQLVTEVDVGRINKMASSTLGEWFKHTASFSVEKQFRDGRQTYSISAMEDTIEKCEEVILKFKNEVYEPFLHAWMNRDAS